MLKVDEPWLGKVEAVYPGFREMVHQWEAMELPPCPQCGSDDTAKVSAGLVGRSIHLAAATTKIRLLPNGHPADYYCNQCKCYFNGPDGGHGTEIGGTFKVIFVPPSKPVRSNDLRRGYRA